MRWLNRYDAHGRTYAVTTGPASGHTVRLKSMGDVVAEYRGHPEAKSLGPDGRPCGRETTGLLRRRPVRAASFVYIGKEANELDDVEEGLVHDLGEVMTEYGHLEDEWEHLILPALRQIPTRELAGRTGLTVRTIQRTIKAGPNATRPHPGNQARLRQAVRTWHADEGNQR
jgi:hypothetical protein